MKKFWILLCLSLIAWTAFAGGQRTAPLILNDKNKQFEVNMVVNSLVILTDSNKLYRLKIAFTATDSMTTVFRRGSTAYIVLNDQVANAATLLNRDTTNHWYSIATRFWASQNFWLKTDTGANKKLAAYYWAVTQFALKTAKSDTFISGAMGGKHLTPYKGGLLYAPIGTVTFPGFGTSHSTAAYGDHSHTGVYAPVATTLSGYGITDGASQTLSKYTTVTGNTTYSSVVPANYMLEYIIIQETAGKTAVLDIGTTASGNDVLNGQTITASSIVTIPIQKVFNLSSTAQSLYLNDAGGGSYWNSASLTLIYVLRKIN